MLTVFKSQQKCLSFFPHRKNGKIIVFVARLARDIFGDFQTLCMDWKFKFDLRWSVWTPPSHPKGAPDGTIEGGGSSGSNPVKLSRASSKSRRLGLSWSSCRSPSFLDPFITFRAPFILLLPHWFASNIIGYVSDYFTFFQLALFYSNYSTGLKKACCIALEVTAVKLYRGALLLHTNIHTRTKSENAPKKSRFKTLRAKQSSLSNFIFFIQIIFKNRILSEAECDILGDFQHIMCKLQRWRQYSVCLMWQKLFAPSCLKKLFSWIVHNNVSGFVCKY